MRIQTQQGSMILMAFYVIVSLLAISASFVTMMVNDRLSATRQVKTEQASALAQAGFEKAISELRSDYRSNSNWYDGTINGNVVTQGHEAYYDFIPSTNEAKGSFVVTLKNIEGATDKIWIKSVGVVGDSRQTIEAYVTVENPSDWAVKIVMWQKI